MNDSNDVIIFGGDSFTWGEGLELYLNTPKWVNERTTLNRWSDLFFKQDYEAKTFRESNRFPTLVANHFKVNPKVYQKNGGQIETPIYLIERNIRNSVGYQPNNIKCIIFQLTTLDRALLHLDMDCQCNFCKITGFEKPFNLYIKFLQSKVHNIPLNDVEHYALKFLNKTENLPINIDLKTIFKNINQYFKPIYVRNLNTLIEKYVTKWEKIAPVYFIDSWDENSSNVIHEISEIKNRLIPLEGYDGRLYTKYTEWENTFPFKRIVDEFPDTFNGHPTLIQHKYISKSIIKHLDGK